MFVNDVQRDPAFFRNHVAEKRFQKNWRYLFFWVDSDAAKNESYQAVQDGTADKTEWEQAEDWYSPLDACVETRLTIALMIK